MEKIVVLYPLPFIGHIVSMVELGKVLLTNSPSLSSITIIIPSYPSDTQHSYSPYLSSVSSSFPSISFISHPPVPDVSCYEGDEHIVFETLRNNNPNVLQSLQTLCNTSTISAFIMDMFCYSALEVSQSFQIPTYFFFASSASVLGFFLNLPVYDTTHTGSSFRDLRISLEIPGLFSLPTSHMIESMLDRGLSFRGFVEMAETFLVSDGIIVNSFEALEVKAIKGLKEGTILPGSRIPPVYCIGPLTAKCGGERHECLSWLDSQPNGSVVYLCFGSLGSFSKEQTREIAIGLERSGVRFLWVVRVSLDEPSETEKDFTPDCWEDRDLNLNTILPQGFINRTRDRGLVVKLWVPQSEVLAHKAVGGFVTHCGWNSILEAVCAGVPMVGWPLYAEQKMNRFSIVEEIGIALLMNETEDRFVRSTEIEKRVKQIMCSEEGDAVRKRVMELKNQAKIAWSQDGSSRTMLSMLIQSLKGLGYIIV